MDDVLGCIFIGCKMLLDLLFAIKIIHYIISTFWIKKTASQNPNWLVRGGKSKGVQRSGICTRVISSTFHLSFHIQANGVKKTPFKEYLIEKYIGFQRLQRSCWFVYSFDAKTTIQNSLTSTCVCVCVFSLLLLIHYRNNLQIISFSFQRCFRFRVICEHKHCVLVYRKTRLKRNLRYKMIQQTTKGKKASEERETNVQTWI